MKTLTFLSPPLSLAKRMDFKPGEYTTISFSKFPLPLQRRGSEKEICGLLSFCGYEE